MTTAPLRRKRGIVAAAAVLATVAAPLATASPAHAEALSCYGSMSPAILHPGQSATIDLTVTGANYLPALITIDGVPDPAASSWWGTISGIGWPFETFDNGSNSTWTFRLYSPETDLQAVDPGTPYLCEIGVQLDRTPLVQPPATQAIDFAPIKDLTVLDTVKPGATSTAGLPVTYTSRTPRVCAVTATRVLGNSGFMGPRKDTVLALSPGSCTIVATQDGTDGVLAADPVSRSFRVHAAGVIPAKAPVRSSVYVLGRAETGAVVTASPAKVCSASGGSVTLTGPGQCTVTVAREGARARAGVIHSYFSAKAATSSSLRREGVVHFKSRSAELSDKAKAKLAGIAAKLADAKTVFVYGHAYGAGRNNAANQALSKARAAAVAEFLRAHGVDGRIVQVAVAQQEARYGTAAANRRAEIYVPVD